jgi:hypothetical protein
LKDVFKKTEFMNITVRTRSQNDLLYERMRSFIPRHIDCYAHAGYNRRKDAAVFLHDAIDNTPGMLLILDEDAYITNWDCIIRLSASMLENNISHAGIPDGGLLAHRKHSYLTFNPFFVLFNCDLIKKVKGNLERAFINSTVFDANLESLKPAWLNNNYNHDYFEPFDGLFYWLAKVGKPLFLCARTLSDGITTEVIDENGNDICLHAWYSRRYGYDEEQRKRINLIFDLAVERNQKNKNKVMNQSQNEDISSAYEDYAINFIFDKQSKDLFAKISLAYDNCFLLAKENNFADAEIQMKLGEQYQTSLGSDVQQWINSFLGQRVAYFFYKTGDFENAINISNKIIGSSKILVENGYQFMFFSSIQQMFNISRIFFARKDVSAALTYSRNAIKQTIVQSFRWKPELFIDTSSFSEKELILNMQYKMIYSIIVESYARAIKAFGSERIDAQNLLRDFTIGMIDLDLENSFGDQQFRDLTAFFQIARGFWTNGTDVIDEAGAAFIQSKNADKKLLKVLFELANAIKASERSKNLT